MTNKGVAYRKLRRRVISESKRAFASMNLCAKAAESLSIMINTASLAMTDFTIAIQKAWENCNEEEVHDVQVQEET